MFAQLITLLVVASNVASESDSPEVRYQGTSGLLASSDQIPFILGSFFQIFEPDWSKGLFSSRWNEPTVTRDGSTVLVTQKALEDKFLTTATFRSVDSSVEAHYRFEWKGDRPVRVEACIAQVWATPFAKLLSGRPVPSAGAAPDARKVMPDAAGFRLPTRHGELQIESSMPLMLLDDRGRPDDAGTSRPTLWLGTSDLVLNPGSTADLRVRFKMPSGTKRDARDREPVQPRSLGQVVEKPDESRPMLLPKPKSDRLNWDVTTELTGAYRFLAGIPKLDDFHQTLALRYPVPKPGANAPAVAFDGGEADLGLAPGGYRIEIAPGRITVLGEKQEGYRNGMRRLAQLVHVKNGKLVLPTGTLIDQPSLPWRGVHLFVGPRAYDFHRTLWRRVLLPLGFNKVVLQLERTNWTAAPGIKTGITIEKNDLLALSRWYAREGIEVIPLIQSFGHMEWLFENDRNRDIAFNPEVPYSIDPRNPRSNQLLGSIWDEAIDLLRPSTIHFGLDEVDMRGFPNDPALVTELWKEQLGFLGRYARDKGKDMMLWGDIALGPGEAPDAMHAPTAEHATARRAAIPRGSWITTWHYKGDQNPQAFMGVLDLWKKAGYRPIGAGWYLPENIRGLALAAVPFRAGYLQTTWAGYESRQENVEQAFDQFAAMVLAGDYSWSGRDERIEALNYQYRDQFRKMFYGIQVPLEGLKVDRYEVGLQLRSRLSDAEDRGVRASIPVQGKGKLLRMRVGAVADLQDGATVATVTIRYADGTSSASAIRYGTHVRAEGDPRKPQMDVPILQLDPSKPLATIELEQADVTTGLRIDQLEIIR